MLVASLSCAIGTPALPVEKIVFAVDGIRQAAPIRACYPGTVCRDGERWKGASAEPATARWGSLQ